MLWPLLALVLPLIRLVSAQASVFQNDHVLSFVDLSSSFVKQTFEITATNVGSEPALEYIIAIPPHISDKIAISEVKDITTARSHKEGTILPVVDSPRSDAHELIVTFPAPVSPGQSVKLFFVQAITNAIHPRPVEADQNARQLMLHTMSHVFYSPYQTVSSESHVRTHPGLYIKVLDSNDDVDSQTVGSQEKEKGTLDFDTVHDVQPYTYRTVDIHYENPKPLVKAVRLVRDIWISHWANSVSFEETYWLKNIGTRLRDSFSRLEFMRSNIASGYNLNIAALRVLPIKLGPRARDAYYTDLVGNVSTSNFFSGKRETSFDVRPRYPLFGGWNYNFTIGWSHDLSPFVRSDAQNHFLVKVPVIEGPADMGYDEIEVKVILPEGANSIEVMSPFASVSDITTTYSYLDTVGRPTVRLVFSNLVDAQRVGEILISYTYTWADALRKPLHLAATVMAVFMVWLFVSKIDVTILRKRK